MQVLLRSSVLGALATIFCAAVTASGAKVVTVAILPARAIPGETNADRWNDFCTGLLREDCSLIRGIRVVDQSSVDFALDDMKLKVSEGLSAAEAARVGKAVEADWVLSWSYQKSGNRWKVEAVAVGVTRPPAKRFAKSAIGWKAIEPELLAYFLAVS